MGWIFWIVVGLAAGFLAEKIMKTDMTLWMNLGVGLVGSILGGFVVTYLTPFRADGGLIWSILVATLGAVLLLWIVGKVRKSASAK
ncbi:MAG: GlsB/YeaQ/YmgE family stress response membrane protein [Bacteroidota bacterium]